MNRRVHPDRVFLDILQDTIASIANSIAVDALKRHYPGREIITLNVDALGEVGGGIHCATQQMPA